MSNNSELSFFDQLRKGVNSIETEVKQLKQTVENGLHLNSETAAQDLASTQEFDRLLRHTYVEVTTLHNTIKCFPYDLNAIQNQIQDMKHVLNQIENSSGLKNYGYKPWVNQHSHSNENQFNNNLEIFSVKSTENGFKNEFNTKLSTDEMTQKSNSSNERTLETAQYVVNSDTNEVKTETHKIDKYLGRTPQPYDFGITRRFTIVPQLFLNNNNNNNNKYKDIEKPTEAPTFDSTTTCRFNYMTNGLNLDTGPNATTANTPPNSFMQSINGTDSFVTVEFTPGLTTKRPKGISRVKDNRKEDKTAHNRNHFPQVLQSVENDKITPEQPIPSTNSSKSGNFVKMNANSSGTPPLPKTRVNVNLHNRLLMKK